VSYGIIVNEVNAQIYAKYVVGLNRPGLITNHGTVGGTVIGVGGSIPSIKFVNDGVAKGTFFGTFFGWRIGYQPC
jgi:hypothetical protein